MKHTIGTVLAALALGLTACAGGNDEQVPLPATPADFAAQIAAGPEVHLTWTDAASNETGYRVDRSADAGASWAPLGPELAPNTQAKTDSTCVEGTTYTYRVVALGVGGDAASAEVTVPFVAAVAPADVVATPTSSSTIDLAWTPGASDAVSFTVYRSTDDVTFAEVAAISWAPGDPPVTTHSDGGLAASTTFYYRVTATNLIGESVQSPSGSATTLAPPATPPTAPTGLATGTTTSSSVALTWTDTSGDETGFKVYRNTSSTCAGATLVATAGANATSYTVSGLSSSTTYYFCVAAANTIGDSAAAGPVSKKTLLAPPTGFTVAAYAPPKSFTFTGIRFTWTDASSDESGFRVYAAQPDRSGTCLGLLTWTEIATAAVNATSVIWDFPGATPPAGTKSCFRMASWNAAGSSYTAAKLFTMP
jgi:titin